jgi:RNA polymerase sigma factor (sigma-70 family)
MQFDEALLTLDTQPRQEVTSRLGAYEVGEAALAEPARLSREEEQKLLERARSGDEAAVAELVDRHAWLLEKLARRHRGRELPLEDLLQIGRVALLESISRYSPDRRTRLSTFAYKRIAGALADAVRNAGRALELGDELSREVVEIAVHEERLAQRLGRWPTWNEVAEDLGITHQRMAELVPHTKWPVSLTSILSATNEAEHDADRRSSVDDPELEREREAAAGVLAELEGGRNASGELEMSMAYTHGELRALLDGYAPARAATETGADALIERGARRSTGLGTRVRLADLDRALQQVPTELFVVLELHGLKQLSLRELRRFTGIPHTTAYDRFKRGLDWLAALLNGEAHSAAPVLRRPFWAADLAPNRLGGTSIMLELFARRGEARDLFDGQRLHQVRDRDVGEGWLLPPDITDFPKDAAQKAFSTRPGKRVHGRQLKRPNRQEVTSESRFVAR